MGTIKSYKDLLVWQKSMNLVEAAYELTEKFPQSEIYGITNQLRRAAVSIPSNIAEGFSRGHRQEYAQFVHIAFGSGAELETQLAIAKRLRFAQIEKFTLPEKLLAEIMPMMNSLAGKLAIPKHH